MSSKQASRSDKTPRASKAEPIMEAFPVPSSAWSLDWVHKVIREVRKTRANKRR